MSILADFKASGYAIGDLQAVRYDRNSPLFPDGYLGFLYRGLGEGRRNGFRRSNLQMTFTGMTDLSFDAIVSYLAAQKLIVLGKWEGQTFRTAGICWPNLLLAERRTGFGSYTALRWIWGSPEEEIFGMLGIAALFEEFNLIQLHGQRYAENHLTARFMARFGFKDVSGPIPRLLAKAGEAEPRPGIISTLSLEDFERNCEERIAAAAGRISLSNP
jgi:hypothetical protein